MADPILIGVDQTGAVLGNGRPRPLPAAVLRDGELRPLSLRHLTASDLLTALRAEDLRGVTLVVDCVLGLPEGVSPGFHEALQMTARTPGYGRDAADAFFRTFKGIESLPRRQVEVRSGANSVFEIFPFQKNIQTGTFRVWKDLARERRWFRIPYLEPDADRMLVPIYEGYPTLAWRQLFGLNTRQPTRFAEMVAEAFPGVKLTRASRVAFERDPNLADAGVLALAGLRWVHESPFRFPAQARREGWILGAE